MRGRFFPAIVRTFGLWGLFGVVLVTPWQVRAAGGHLEECKARVRGEPGSLAGYICFLVHQREGVGEALRFLDERMRVDPANPRPHLYAAVLRTLLGEAVHPDEWRVAMQGFAREHEVAGEVYAATSLAVALCTGNHGCSEEAHALLRHAQELARASGRVDLQQAAEIYRMKVEFFLDDMDAASSTEARLLALGPSRSPWISSETLQARAHLAASLGDFRRQRALYGELLKTLDADDPRRAAAMGGEASAVVHLAMQRLESRATAERMVRAAIAEQKKAGVSLRYPEVGYLSSQTQLAMLLGPTPEAFSLLHSVLDAQLSRKSYSTPAHPRLTLGEWLATADPPHLEEALQVAEDAVQGAFRIGEYEQARALVLRSRVQFRRGEFSAARADGLAALDHAERLREVQQAMPIRLRYSQSLSFAYLSLAGGLVRYRSAGDVDSVGDAFVVMERLRARGLMETLLASSRIGDRVAVEPATLAQVQARLGANEALLSFQIWRAEPMMDAPYREGSSWVTVVTRSRVDAFPIPNADVLEPQVRAWNGLLERRDGSDRPAGAWLHRELLAPALTVLPKEIDRLVIVPDGPLHRLPFDGLSAGLGKPYLAERFTVSIAPSASLWVRLRTSEQLPAGKLLVLADPAEGSAARAILRDSTGAFGALIHARREAEVAMAAFPAGELRTGAPASEKFLKSAPLDGVSLLHLATHAVVDERDPEHAAVVLAPGSESEDGRLEPQEIGRLPLGGKTVVLAGCETSAGPVFRGEGVMSLARAFFGAGASTVVGTLDRARDDEAGVFFSSMYRALARGISVGDAVTTAKREGIRRGAPPAAWADVVLLGDAEVHPRARETVGLVPLAVGGLVLAVVGAGVGHRRWRLRKTQNRS
jgi:CHAT domain-containing protein